MADSSDTLPSSLLPGSSWPAAEWLGVCRFRAEVLLVKAPGGDATVRIRVEDSAITVDDDSSAPADMKVEIKWKDAVAVASGEVDPAVAFMRGVLKPAGDMELVLDLLKRCTSPDFKTWRAQAA